MRPVSRPACVILVVGAMSVPSAALPETLPGCAPGATTCYDAGDDAEDACLTSAFAHPHGCPSPHNVVQYPSLDLVGLKVQSDPSAKVLAVTAAMSGAIPTAFPATLTAGPRGATGAIYRFFMTHTSGQYCVNLMIGALSGVAPSPAWPTVATIGRWELALEPSGVTGRCAVQRPLEPAPLVVGNQIRWAIPYAVFGAAPGQLLEDLGVVTEAAFGTGLGVRSDPVAQTHTGIGVNIDIGPGECDASGLHGLGCEGEVVL